MASRNKPRGNTFFDDPPAYPEYALLMKRQRLHHALRCGFHRHRTAALLFIVAISVANSGAEIPAASDATSADWRAYLAEGINFDLLARHFEGFASAIGCMLATTLASLLVYPLHSWASSPTATAGDGLSHPTPTAPNAAAVTMATAAPLSLVWIVAVWGAGRFPWGAAAGLAVGLHCTGITLKSVSYVQACGLRLAALRATAVATVEVPSVLADVPDDHPVTSTSTDRVPIKHGEDGAAGGKGVAAINAVPAAAAALPKEENEGADGQRSDTGALPFSEFAFFLTAVPSLVCEPQFLRRHARRPRNATRAALEFFHAGLTYLAVHVTCSVFFAPVLRVLATALHSGWTDDDAWAALRAEGSGGWLETIALAAHRWRGGAPGAWEREIILETGLESQHWTATMVIAVCLGLLVFPSVMHFLMFYAFWHCVCLGSAELWGYPDRNMYGPWWLVSDDLRDYFRMWSAPVYRWLAASVQRPILEAGRRAARRHASCRRPCGVGNQQGDEKPRLGSCNGNVGENADSTSATATTSDRAGSQDVAAARSTRRDSLACSPDASRTGNGRKSGDRFDGGGKSIYWMWWLASVVCSFLVSGLLHEAVAFIAMRRTVWGVNTLFLAVSASATPFWDTMFPTVGPAAAEASGGASARPAADGGELPPPIPTAGEGVSSFPRAPLDQPSDVGESVRAEGRARGHGNAATRSRTTRAAIGSSRGWVAFVFYMVASLPATLAFDYFLWQWWRHTVMVG